jgi:hypothetical protein
LIGKQEVNRIGGIPRGDRKGLLKFIVKKQHGRLWIG